MHANQGGIGEWVGRRFWESRQFYSAYIALFISISNWITIQYTLLLENVPVFNLLFSNIVVFLVVAAIVFSILSILGGHYIHRKRQFRIEQAVATEENPYLYRAAPGKERDLMIPIAIMQIDAMEAILKSNDMLTEDKVEKINSFRKDLAKLSEGQPVGNFARKKTGSREGIGSVAT